MKYNCLVCGKVLKHGENFCGGECEAKWRRVTVTPVVTKAVTITLPVAVSPVTVTLYAACPECEGTGRILASVLKARRGNAERQAAYRERNAR